MAAKAGERCQLCHDGTMAVASSQRSGEYQTRYLRCSRCGRTDKQTVPAGEIVRRKLFTSDRP